MLLKILILILITQLPFFELRASIPLGILSGTISLPFGLTMSGFGMDWRLVFIVCVIANAFVGMIAYPITHILFLLLEKNHKIHNLWLRFVNRSQRKIHPYVEKWGMLGVAIFVGIPLPGSGSYSGALGSYVLGLGYKRFVLANVLGVFIAGVLVTLVTLTGKGFFALLNLS